MPNTDIVLNYRYPAPARDGPCLWKTWCQTSHVWNFGAILPFWAYEPLFLWLITFCPASQCGGFLSDRWLHQAEPDAYSGNLTPSQRKVRNTNTTKLAISFPFLILLSVTVSWHDQKCLGGLGAFSILACHLATDRWSAWQVEHRKHCHTMGSWSACCGCSHRW